MYGCRPHSILRVPLFTNKRHAPILRVQTEAARPKVKVGGVLAFNDYYIFEWGFLAKKGRWGVYGVVHAVNEFIIRYKGDWELIYYTFSAGGGDGGDLGLRRVR